MSSKVLLILIGGVVVAGGAFFFLSGSNDRGAVAENTGAMNGSFASLISGGQNLECTFEHNDGVNVSSGTVYIASGGDRLSGHFSIKQSGAGAQEAYMVRDDGYNYIWGSFYSQGIKSKVTAENKGKLFDKEDGAVDENTDFECKRWSVDESMFRLPSGVQFMDISAQMNQMMDAQGSMGDMKAMQCAACDQLPAGQGREQCRAALSC